MEHFLTRDQVTEALSVSRDTVDRLILAGELEAVKVRRCVRISRQSLRAYLEANKIEPSPRYLGVCPSMYP